MKLIHLSLAVVVSSQLAFSFSLDDITKIATDTLKQEPKSVSTPSASTDVISSGLKEALNIGVQNAVKSLSGDNGYLNSIVKIPLPDSLNSAKEIINKAGGQKYTDDLIKAMNTAASQAAPKTASVFLESIKNMNIDDANKILKGSNTATTQYFKENTYNKLKELILPIVQKSIANNDVAKYYDAFNSAYKTYGKGLVEQSGVMGYAKSFGVDQFIPSGDDKSLDEYVTTKAIDGLFTMIEKEEIAIRENPLNRTTDLLKQVFK